MKKIQVGGHRGGKIYGYTLVDDVEFDRLNRFKWSNNGHGYAVKSSGEHISMARMILGNNNKFEVDHINGNQLDNRRHNLRLASKAENARNVGKHSHNTSGFKGVSFHKRIKKFQTRIRVNRELIHLGYFNTAQEGAIAYNTAAEKYHGDFAKFNIIK
jgi:hypothetical protein